MSLSWMFETFTTIAPAVAIAPPSLIPLTPERLVRVDAHFKRNDTGFT